MEGYRVLFYIDSKRNNMPVVNFIESLPLKVQSKILKYIDFLRDARGYLDEPYSRHLWGKIRELRVDFGKRRFRIIYFLIIKKRIIILHGFEKSTQKIPTKHLRIAIQRYQDVSRNLQLYEGPK